MRDQLAFLRQQRDIAPDEATRAMFESLIASLMAQQGTGATDSVALFDTGHPNGGNNIQVGNISGGVVSGELIGVVHCLMQCYHTGGYADCTHLSPLWIDETTYKRAYGQQTPHTAPGSADPAQRPFPHAAAASQWPAQSPLAALSDSADKGLVTPSMMEDSSHMSTRRIHISRYL